ncbi:MAG: 2'-deoxycytidine 5'-triphosphate deaminase [Ruminococcus flavefaciens]|nr:2'-deoxycytidine 5'-triphosphate deaminase [Ruminococcus flavefaciens]
MSLLKRQLGGILTGTEIIKQVQLGRLMISDFDESRVNPNSYNIRLGDSVTVYDAIGVIDMHDPSTYTGKTKTYKLSKETGFMLRPGITYLIPSLESIHSPYYEPIITGRSSVGRLGIRVHEEAGFADIGFNGHLTHQMKVTYPTLIYAGDPMAQVYFLTPHGDTTMQYEGKYAGSGNIASKWKGTDE